MIEFLNEPEFWVTLGTLILLGVFVWIKVPGMVARALDVRAALIAKELDEATKLREEAEALLAQYRLKRDRAEADARAILAEAKAEAERFALEARTALAAQIERQAKQAQDKIAQAEARAVTEVRGLVVDAAVTAAQKLIAARLTEEKAAALVKDSLRTLPDKLN